jgi:hypothetical protein
MSSIYLVIENIRLAKNDIEHVPIEAHMSKEAALFACKNYMEQGKQCWIDEIDLITTNDFIQQKLNFL